MDIKFQLKGEIEHPEMKGLTDIDYTDDIKPKSQTNTISNFQIYEPWWSKSTRLAY